MAKTYEGLRDFLETLEAEGQLVRVKEEICLQRLYSSSQ